jgi:hypothetical protein
MYKEALLARTDTIPVHLSRGRPAGEPPAEDEADEVGP